jgi:hypothetical protein
MSDTITARASESKFKPHDEGQFVGQCVDTIDLGEKVQDFPGTKPYLAQTCALVFRTGEKNPDTGDFIDIAREFTVSMGEKANLRKFLEQWRGKPYTADQIKAGVPLDKLTGNHGLLTVAHRESAKQRVYANITACVGVPKQMAGALTDYGAGYERADYWAAKKKEYADAAATFRGADVPSDDDFPPALDDDDDGLPF